LVSKKPLQIAGAFFIVLIAVCNGTELTNGGYRAFCSNLRHASRARGANSKATLPNPAGPPSLALQEPPAASSSTPVVVASAAALAEMSAIGVGVGVDVGITVGIGVGVGVRVGSGVGVGVIVGVGVSVGTGVGVSVGTGVGVGKGGNTSRKFSLRAPSSNTSP
jgi:hypothetical protein